MTKGIFNYQVPGRTPATNENKTATTPVSAHATKQYQTSVSGNSEQLSNANSLISSLLQNILQKLGLGHGDSGSKPSTPATPTPKPDVTTLALGEEDGGIKNPPDVTTLALGEEDGGIKNPPDVTTLALGEEDGGIKNPPDVTTLALGEEDGGIKNPPDVTTLALGEEDGGLTKALGEEGNHQTPQIAVCPKPSLAS
ncbi:hypothetical protein SAMN02745130_03108 [Thiothrix eikelboomii]|uniref:Uncharacterized protein n=1 Tax=Thiothrix eikelboomii TaxID=92487 RepID=A0A1T4XKZ0_9GAMM|nr:hypothetical protein [Thiothrix eikelboomii]SKA90174.1 hypothetical protein SAMN02745130_03108 [Thiothrix eikelboomii]